MPAVTHAHHHHHHDHSPPHPPAAGNERRALLAFAITLSFMAVEAAGGWLAGSLALLADAAHMLTDAVALGLAWGAFRLGRLPPDSRRSYGYRRWEVLAAFVNGLLVMALAGWIVAEAFGRIGTPAPVQGGLMLGVAVAGLAVNLLVLRVLGGHAHDNLNLRGAALHVLGDLLGSAAAVAAALVILATGWTPIDAILSLGVAALILVNAIRLIRQTTHILLEGTPEGVDPRRIATELVERVPGLVEVHHLHAWSVTSGQSMITLHAVIAPEVEAETVLAAIKHVLAHDYHLSHSVVQVERRACADTACGG